MDLTGKKILITGSSSGLGRACAIYLAELGARIVLTGRNLEQLNQTLGLLEGNGHFVVNGDLTVSDDIKRIVDEGLATDGCKFSGLIYAAGGGKLLPLRSITHQLLVDTMTLNFFSFVEMVKAITARKACDLGSIVGISSYAATEGEAGLTVYSAAKAAMDASVRTMACELAGKKIRVNSVRPGMMDTPGTQIYMQNMEHDYVQGLIGKQLLGLGKPNDVAAMCAFLVSDASQFITGRTFYVDGGRFN